MSAPVVVVGAGPSGLGAAVALAARRRVVVVDRIPVPGGEHGWDRPEVREYAARAATAGAVLRLGVTALRWTGSTLLAVGPTGVQRLEADALLFAGGLRPATAGDLGLVGDRPAGILPGTVADHLLATGVALWHHPVVVGTGPWAAPVAERIAATGGPVTALVAPGQAAPWATRTVELVGGLRARGRDRVRALVAETPHGWQEIPCDAVILAADPRPNRNVDGAIADDAAGVVFLQPTHPHDLAARFDLARAAAQAWLRDPATPRATTGGAP